CRAPSRHGSCRSQGGRRGGFRASTERRNENTPHDSKRTGSRLPAGIVSDPALKPGWQRSRVECPRKAGDLCARCLVQRRALLREAAPTTRRLRCKTPPPQLPTRPRESRRAELTSFPSSEVVRLPESSLPIPSERSHSALCERFLPL